MKLKTKYAAGMRDALWGWLAAREGAAGYTGGDEWFHGWRS